MKHKNLNQKLEEIARAHLGIDVFSQIPTLEKSLKEAYLLGEKVGYKHGFSDAKEACLCNLEEEPNEPLIFKTN